MATAVNDENITSRQDSGRRANSGDRDQGNVLQMVNKGFDEKTVFESRQYKFAMEMLEDPKLKGNTMYEKLVTRLSAFLLN